MLLTLSWLLPVVGALLVLPFYVTPPEGAALAGYGVSAVLVVVGLGVYLVKRPAAHRLVWPPDGSEAAP